MPDVEIRECPQCTKSDMSLIGSRVVLGVRSVEWTCNECGHAFETRTVIPVRVLRKGVVDDGP